MTETEQAIELYFPQDWAGGVPKIHVVENFLPSPYHYRSEALKKEFQRIDFGKVIFDGLVILPLDCFVARFLKTLFPGLEPNFTSLRKSPLNQREPNYVHCDILLGNWTAILYLNPNPPKGDGTDFWEHIETGAVGGDAESALSMFREPSHGNIWTHVEAKFNRLTLFPSKLFHSRAIFENYGEGDDARLIQVVFCKGDIE